MWVVSPGPGNSTFNPRVKVGGASKGWIFLQLRDKTDQALRLCEPRTDDKCHREAHVPMDMAWLSGRKKPI